MCDQIDRLQWSLGPGQVAKALGQSDALESAMEPCSATSARYAGGVQAWAAWRTDIEHNRPLLPHDGERYRNGEPMATGFGESTVHEVGRQRFGKRQQMPWANEGAQVL
jgi:hypothetical protein